MFPDSYKNLIKFEAEGDKGGGGEGDKGGADDSKVDLSAPEVKAAIETATAAAVKELKTKNEQLREEKVNANKKLQEFEGINPEEVRKLKDEAEKSEREKQEKAGNWDSLKIQMQEKHGKEIKEKDDRIAFLYKAVETHLVDSKLTRALAEAKGSAHLLLHPLKQHVGVYEENDQILARVIDPGTNTPRIGDASGKPMTMEQLVAEFKENDIYAQAFEATGTGGSGAPANGSKGPRGVKGNSMKRSDYNKLPSTEFDEVTDKVRKGDFKIVEDGDAG